MSALASDNELLQPTAAELLAEDGNFWARGIGKVSGRRFYVIPSRTEDGKAHWTTDYGCTCKGFNRRGHCAHVEAVTLYEAGLRLLAPQKLWVRRYTQGAS